MYWLQRSGGKNDGCVIAIKAEEFDLVDGPVTIEFDELVPLDAVADADPAWLAYRQTHPEVFVKDGFDRERLRRHNIALLLTVRHRGSGRYLILATTHLYWNPEFEDVKLLQTHALLFRLAAQVKHAQQTYGTPHVPVILGGDFNSLPESKVYALIANGHCSPRSFLKATARLYLDNDCIKVAKYLRSVGVDCIVAERGASIEHMFKHSQDDGRVFVTRSKAIAARRLCPPHVLLLSQNVSENFQHLIRLFQFPIGPATVYTRCTECNGLFHLVPPESYHAMKSVPACIRGGVDRAGNALEFFMCGSCEQVYWYGNQTSKALDRLILFLEPVMDTVALRQFWTERRHLDPGPDKTQPDEEQEEVVPGLLLELVATSSAEPVAPQEHAAIDNGMCWLYIHRRKMGGSHKCVNEARPCTLPGRCLFSFLVTNRRRWLMALGYHLFCTLLAIDFFLCPSQWAYHGQFW